MDVLRVHYRSHGAAVGRVLAGPQHVGGDPARIQEFLDAVGYSYRDHTDDPAHRIFLTWQLESIHRTHDIRAFSRDHAGRVEEKQ